MYTLEVTDYDCTHCTYFKANILRSQRGTIYILFLIILAFIMAF